MGARFTAAQQQQMDRLHRAYLRELPRKLRAIEEAAAPLLETPGRAREALESLYLLVHRLTGSAAVYGLGDLSRAAAALEDALRPALDSGDGSAPAQPLLRKLLAELRRTGELYFTGS